MQIILTGLAAVATVLSMVAILWAIKEVAFSKPPFYSQFAVFMMGLGIILSVMPVFFMDRSGMFAVEVAGLVSLISGCAMLIWHRRMTA